VIVCASVSWDPSWYLQTATGFVAEKTGLFLFFIALIAFDVVQVFKVYSDPSLLMSTK